MWLVFSLNLAFALVGLNVDGFVQCIALKVSFFSQVYAQICVVFSSEKEKSNANCLHPTKRSTSGKSQLCFVFCLCVCVFWHLQNFHSRMILPISYPSVKKITQQNYSEY